MALKQFVLNGKNIAYSDTGAGAETVILIHCSGASHRIFKRLIEILSSRYRVLAPDLAGYGSSEDWPTNESFHYSYDISIINRLISLCRTPVHLIGYSYGGFLSLEVALGAQAVQSMILLEPVALQLLRHGENPQLQKEVEVMGERVINNAKNGRRSRAARSYVNYWGSPFSWLFTPGRIKHNLRRTVHKTAMEFASGYDAPTGVERFQRIQCPVLLLVGGKTRESAKAVAAILDNALPHCEYAQLKGASHLTLLQSAGITGMVQQWLEQHPAQALQSA